MSEQSRQFYEAKSRELRPMILSPMGDLRLRNGAASCETYVDAISELLSREGAARHAIVQSSERLWDYFFLPLLACACEAPGTRERAIQLYEEVLTEMERIGSLPSETPLYQKLLFDAKKGKSFVDLNASTRFKRGSSE